MMERSWALPQSAATDARLNAAIWLITPLGDLRIDIMNLRHVVS
jgi:hypothetical protein